MPVAAYYLHDPAAPRPNSPTRMGTNVLLECRGRLLLEQRWDCGAWGLPGGRLRRGESEARGIARELFEETGLRLPEAAFTRVRVVDDADRIASYQDGTVWRMVIVLFRAQLPQEPELHCSRESCTLRFFTPEELRKLHAGKTGALFIAAIRGGAHLAGANDQQLLALTKFADLLGLAFQITDDILDVEGTEEELGKPVGSDAKNHKSTYVTLYGLQAAHELAEKTVAEALECLEMFGENAEPLREITRLMTNRKK